MLFFVILEAAFIVYSFVLLNSTWGYPSTVCYHRFIGTVPLLSLG